MRGFPRRTEAPHVLPKASRRALGRCVRSLDAALRALARALFAPGGRLWEDLRPPEPLRPLLITPLPDVPVPFFRIDAFFDPREGTLEVMEANCADPSGVGLHDALAEEAERGGAPRVPRLWAAHLEALRAAGRCRGTPPPATNLVIDPRSPTRSDFACLAAVLGRAGIECRLLTPGEALDLPAGSLVYHDYLYELVDGPSPSMNAAWRRAIVGRKFRFVTSPHANVLEAKAALALLSGASPGRVRGVPRVREVAWTRVVRASVELAEGRRVDLPRYCLAAKDRLVLKPSYGYGGAGVVIGRFARRSEWERAVERALTEPGLWVVQRACDGLVAGPRRRERVVLSLWSHLGRLTGAFVRKAAAPSVNVRSGAALGLAVFA